MAEKMHGDFETKSLVDLTKLGFGRYMECPSTDAHCFAFAFDDEPDVPVIDVRRNPECPPRLRAHIKSGGLFYAHNAQFEFAIWNQRMVPRYGWPKVHIEQMRCTMAMCFAMALPGKLELAAPALGVDAAKDMIGSKIMLQICRPRKRWLPGVKDYDKAVAAALENAEHIARTGQYLEHNFQLLDTGEVVSWWTDESKYERTRSYCQQDVRTERAVCSRLLPLSKSEQAIWVLDQKINNYGVRLDVPAVKGAIVLVENEKARMNAEMKAATSGYVEKCTQSARLTDWLLAKGCITAGATKADVKALLDDEDLPGDLTAEVEQLFAPPGVEIVGDVRRALLVRQEANRASAAKLTKMLQVMTQDEIIRFILQYHAAQPGRWGGRKVQPHNFPRPTKAFEDYELQHDVLCAFAQGWSNQKIALFFGQPMEAVASTLRGLLLPHHGCDLLVGDYSNIEGRGLAWLAGDENKLDVFRRQDAKTGPEVYIVAGAQIYGVDPSTLTKKSYERQIGKVGELALGYGGGKGAFKAMAKVYGIDDIPDARAEQIKEAWRNAHPKIAGTPDDRGRRIGGYWNDLEEAALNAIRRPGSKFKAGGVNREVTYLVNGSFLWARMPSGRALCYPYPEIREVVTPWGKTKEAVTFKTVLGGAAAKTTKRVPDATNTGRFGRVSSHGGVFSQNCLAADTKVLTSSGWKAIVDVLPADMVHDGSDWVRHEGVLHRGQQETGEWLNVRLTADHKILDGNQWTSAGQMGVLSSLGALLLGLSSAVGKLLNPKWATSEPVSAGASAGASSLSVIGFSTENNLPAVTDAAAAGKQIEHAQTQLLLTRFCGRSGEGAGTGSSLAAKTPNARPTQTMAAAASPSATNGFLTQTDSSATLAPCPTGTVSGLISTVSTTSVVTSKEISGSSLVPSMQQTDAGRSSYPWPGRPSLSTSSVLDIAQAGTEAPSPITSSGAEAQFGSWTATGQREDVYDLLNCGPQHRFVIQTSYGPVLVHNCTEAICRDYLAEALVRVDARGWPVSFHVHDEAVANCRSDAPPETLKEFEAEMARSPAWAAGLPVVVDCYRGSRYAKR